MPQWISAGLLAPASILALVALTTACAPTAGQAPPPVAATEPRKNPNVPTLEAMVELALDDAAKRTGRDRTALVVESAEAVTWSDGSIGCPEPGMMYTQALVPGYRVVIRAGEETFDYHSSQRGTPVLCPSGRAVDPLPLDST